MIDTRVTIDNDPGILTGGLAETSNVFWDLGRSETLEASLAGLLMSPNIRETQPFRLHDGIFKLGVKQHPSHGLILSSTSSILV